MLFALCMPAETNKDIDVVDAYDQAMGEIGRYQIDT